MMIYFWDKFGASSCVSNQFVSKGKKDQVSSWMVLETRDNKLMVIVMNIFYLVSGWITLVAQIEIRQ